ncbi:radical SAM protein [candidate division KSB1 bacterium]|nr:radical SAM protein [candidate division KSB1 bacterium]
MQKGFNSQVLNRALGVFFKDAVYVSLTNPRQALHFIKTVRWQKTAARKRNILLKEGLQVPPIIIFSITNRCNLTCKGCYAQALQNSTNDEIDDSKLWQVVSEADELGVSFFVIAGGEPLLRKEMLKIIKSFPQIIFLFITNGLLIDDNTINTLKETRNVMTLFSLEGCKSETDDRRGEGTFDIVLEKMKRLKKENLFFGTSITLTRHNFNTVMSDLYIKEIFQTGCRFFLILEYTPVQKGTENWVLETEQRKQILPMFDHFRKKYSSLFIAVPSHEEEVGGCLAAGRGFIHINSKGQVEPCPFGPFSDTDIVNHSLKDALQSKLLQTIRNHPERLNEKDGICAMWSNREWVQSLLTNEKKASHAKKVANIW